jgi:hypothetical protein
VDVGGAVRLGAALLLRHPPDHPAAVLMPDRTTFGLFVLILGLFGGILAAAFLP